LRQCLNSLLEQAADDIEIIIVDGASTDDTSEVIKQFRGLYPNLVHYLRQEGVGVDRDILLSVHLAKGRFCWLMSDDDKLEPGALSYVRKILDTHGDSLTGISVNIAAYDRELKYRVRAVPSISGNRLVGDYLFEDRNQCFSLLGLHFGFISGQIVNRKGWNAVASSRPLEPFCNAWILVYMIGEMLRSDPVKWFYVNKKLVAYRSGNDSFAARLGVYGRQLITHVNFEFTLRALFGASSTVYTRVLMTIVSDRMPRSLAVIKADGCDFSTQLKLLRLYVGRYSMFPRFWIKVFPLFLIPNSVLSLIRKFYFRRMSRLRHGPAANCTRTSG